MANIAPKLYVQRPILERLQFALRLYTLKFLSTLALKVLQLPGIRDISTIPTYTQTYRCRPHLTNRIFIPKSYKSGDALLPLYLSIHGGGFAMFDPSIDDKFCSEFSNENKVVVVSINYPKSPANPYPAAVQALTDIVRAVLADEALPFDKKRVAIGGFSAGANLALAVSQDASLQQRIGGLVAYYPPVDWRTSLEQKLATRPKNAPPDALLNNALPFDWAYIRPGQDLRDPQLSVALAPREKLPRKTYIIGCELDMLCKDAELMAERLATIGNGQRVGADIAWERNGVKWEKILGEEHGFDLTPAFGDKKLRVAQRRQEMHASVAEWLFREVY